MREIHEPPPEVVRFLNPPQGKAILRTHCPKMIVVRWLRLHGIPEFISDNVESVNAAVALHGMPLIPEDRRDLAQIQVPLLLSSHAIEVRSRMPCEMIPSIHKVFLRWRILRGKSRGFCELIDLWKQ
jgi:hypothetical protein